MKDKIQNEDLLSKKKQQTSLINQTNKDSNAKRRQHLDVHLKKQLLIEKDSSRKEEEKVTPSQSQIDPISTATVEDLLSNLNRIDRESELLLQSERETYDSLKVNDNNNNKYQSKETNSILSFLDDEEQNTKTTTFRQPTAQFRDYKSLEQKIATELEELREKQQQPPKWKTEAATILPSNNVKLTTNVKLAPTPKQKTIKKTEKDDDTTGGDNTAELKAKIYQQQLEIDDKTRTIASLEKGLSQQRELTIRHGQEAEKEMNLRIESQKNDYETIIQRHLSFIDQLIDDKKLLSEKCEQLVKELKDVEKNYSERLRQCEDRYKIDSQKLKDTLMAAEKIRRDKWIEEKTKKIKEMTVKGLEPEIQSLITKHKNEIKSLKSIHDAELLQADERASQRYIRITEELRENYEREKEASCQKERDLCRQRYEKSLEEEEKSFLEQRRRLYAEIEEEKNRIADQSNFQRRELDRLRKNLEENNLNAIETIKKEYQISKDELINKHQLEMKNQQEKLAIEKQTWEENYLKKQENWMLQKERELKEQVKRERDKEIETIITRLDTDSTMTREEIERTAENRVKRIRDKYEAELTEVEKSERETMERYNQLKAKYNEIEGDYETLKVVVKQKEKDFEGIKKLTDTLQDERNRLADVIRQDFSDRLVYTEEENKKIKLEMNELKSRQQLDIEKKQKEIDKLQKEKADELATVHEK
jgi:hypothetical protein